MKVRLQSRRKSLASGQALAEGNPGAMDQALDRVLGAVQDLRRLRQGELVDTVQPERLSLKLRQLQD